MMEIHPEYQKTAKPRPIILPLIIWIGVILAVLVLMAGLSGCATTEESKVCFMKLLGQTEQGYSVVVQSCMTPEQFAESQK